MPRRRRPPRHRWHRRPEHSSASPHRWSARSTSPTRWPRSRRRRRTRDPDDHAPRLRREAADAVGDALQPSGAGSGSGSVSPSRCSTACSHLGQLALHHAPRTPSAATVRCRGRRPRSRAVHRRRVAAPCRRHRSRPRRQQSTAGPAVPRAAGERRAAGRHGRRHQRHEAPEEHPLTEPEVGRRSRPGFDAPPGHLVHEQLAASSTRPSASMTAVIPETEACRTGRPVSAARIWLSATCCAESRPAVRAVVRGHHEELRAVAHASRARAGRTPTRSRSSSRTGGRAALKSTRLAPRLEVERDLLERADEPEQAAPRHVLAERHEVLLRVAPLQRAVGS